VSGLLKESDISALKWSDFIIETRRDATRRDATRSTRLVTIRVNCPAVAAPTRHSDVVMHSLEPSQAARSPDGADVVACIVLLHSRLARTWCNYSLQFRVPPECHGDAPTMPSKRPMHSARSLCTSISFPRPLDAARNYASTHSRFFFGLRCPTTCY